MNIQRPRTIYSTVAFLFIGICLLFCQGRAEAAQAMPPASITVPASDPDGNFVVSWEASVTEGVLYELQEATNLFFTTGRRTAYLSTGLSATISGRTAGVYYYRVRAIKSGYTASVWRTGANGCAVPGTKAGTPSSITVPVADLDGSYVVSWGASSTAGVTYELQEAADSAFTTGLKTLYHGQGLSALLNERAAGSVYYYRVRAKRTGYENSIWRTAAHSGAVGRYQAIGTYDFNSVSNQLTLRIEMTNYPACWGSSKAEMVHLKVTELTPTILAWIDAGGNPMTWTGSNSGGLAGTWTSDNPEVPMNLIVHEDGTWNVNSDKSEVDSNSDCSIFTVPQEAITIDGDYLDWKLPPVPAVYIDNDGPDCGDAPGQDIKEVYIAQDAQHVYLRFVLNGPMDPSFGYKFGNNLHLRIREAWPVGDMDWATPLAGLSAEHVNSGALHFDYDNLFHIYQFEARFNKCDIKGWWDDKDDVAVWCDQGYETVCRDYIELPRLIFDFSSCGAQ